MNHYKIIIAYNGTDYQGWQSQKSGTTICQTMQHSFFRTFKIPCTIIGVSRTDAGVHAEGQVALVRTTLQLDSERLKKAWNKVLPSSIMIKTCKSVLSDFNPFSGIILKTYQYTIYKKRPHPFVAPFGWFYDFEIDEDLLQQALALFVGQHDFTAFSTHEPGIDTNRTIQTIHVSSDISKVVITMQGKSFIRHMIRRIVGAAVIVATTQTRTIDDITRLLHTQDANCYCFMTAPACGLCLIEIYYAKESS